MRIWTTLALAVTAVAGALAQQEGPTFRATTQLVSVPATVLEADGRLVPGLDQDQFTILDNTKPQKIVFFQNETQPPADGQLPTRSLPAQDRRGHGRRLLRVEEDRRARANLHKGRAGASQPVHDRLRAADARRQGAQDRREDETAGTDGPRAQVVRRIGRSPVEVGTKGLRN